jgi:multicomponent Na+:H+ antiporter subunit A
MVQAGIYLLARMTPVLGGTPLWASLLTLFGGLTLLWAGVHIVTAAMTFGLLTTLPVATFVAFKTVACLSVTIAAIVVTIFWALRVVHSERLVFAPGPY